jgi:hypothetical protein
MVKQKWYTSLPQVSFEYADQWPGLGRCSDAAVTSESSVMVNVPNNTAEGRSR